LTQSPARMREYVDAPRPAAFLCDELLPALHARYPLRDDASGRALMGASLGAVASLTAAWRRPGLFGRLLLKSGSFMVTEASFHGRDPLFAHIHGVIAAFRRNPGEVPPRIFVSCGLYEGLIDQNRAMVAFLREHGADVLFVEALDGHHWQNWRDQLRVGLAWVFPETAADGGQ
ncbi:MAG: enterochelin esterase, partial [Inquilinus sp.]|nr:enterochelin esterase [Inquilinus sp.]